MNNFTEKELVRYKRQIMLKEVGIEGQNKLKNSKVLIIGAGGLGSPNALYLTASGIGTIGIIDHDIVDLSNLQRQIIHNTNDLGTEKVLSAKDKMLMLNPFVNVITYHCRLDEINIKNILKDYDITIVAVDNIETRYIINEACVQQNKIMIDGAINNFNGYVMPIVPGKTPCYECVYPKDDTISVHKEIGVIGCLPGIIGSLQAMEAIKFILNGKSELENKILFYDAFKTNFRELAIEKDISCPICGK